MVGSQADAVLVVGALVVGSQADAVLVDVCALIHT